ncbi:spore coat protein [Alkalihalobacillus alcalophilus ATCC 27647 = CGMCC 1.3604]|uniref:Spore coat protein n=1 Tax=Alkalihalobacillus alcalophilus ATCC 27647 = CGMCC 1.3604 TaxID=1218173 RepID=A0A094XJK6_ALKAL|nr:TasA family protein [Alkalihalobacillus alcalophilus]KGA98950.1 spore coat protein [Alkalihalobacillus alcalophilus ATCC 27647 = CGMCC 1.3604]MED1561985.1 TasA family protein [Alkalihalobacillus alcalophilus]THG89133.1 spore coat protein [Alkalihalobacillus alcalophilus ATCC 27647 = CGMCC 1.3604]
MSIKKKLGMGVLTAALGISLIGGGTFAYFSDTATQTNTFASGTIVLDVDPTVQIPMENIKPGDWMPRSFELQNNGSLDMKYVDLKTEYKVTKNGEAVPNPLANKYAEQLYVQFLKNTTGDEDYEVLFEVSLKDLRDLTPEDLATKVNLEEIMLEEGYEYWQWIIWPLFGKWVTVDPIFGEVSEEITGIKAGETADFTVQFRFNDTGKAQNDLQDLDLDLTWTFEGFQTDGEER